MKRTIILLMALLLFLAGCVKPLYTDKDLTGSTLIHQDNAKEIYENNTEKIGETVTGEIKTTEDTEAAASVTYKAPELIGTRMSFNSLLETDDAMIRKAEEMGLESPFCEVDIYRYSPKDKK
jgi:hypothetical protein